MPTRRLPYTLAQRIKALFTGKSRKDSMPPPLIIPYKPSTINMLDIFYPPFKAKVDGLDVLLNTQVTISDQLKTARPLAELFISHFYEAMQNAIKRKTFESTVRTLYGLDANDGNLPVLRSEADITYWGGKAVSGEAARMLLPGAVPITFPSIAEVTAIVGNFESLNTQQADAKEAYDNGQESIAADDVAADELILRMWNETEAEFDKGDKPSMRRKSREWGVIYVPTPGETPSPDDFSIIGTVTHAVTGDELADVEVKIVETDEVFSTNNNGEYFIPVLIPGTYTLQITKTGYTPQNLPGIVVSEGVITEQDVVLSPAAATGTVSGNVKQTGINVKGANISIMGVPLLTAITDDNGNYSISNVPPGMQNVQAQLPPANGGMTQMQNVNVMAGAEVNASFVF